MRVDPQDATCRSCGGILEITDVDDATMTVECQSDGCADSYVVETDAFNDGGITYWPAMMSDKLQERFRE